MRRPVAVVIGVLALIGVALVVWRHAGRVPVPSPSPAPGPVGNEEPESGDLDGPSPVDTAAAAERRARAPRLADVATTAEAGEATQPQWTVRVVDGRGEPMAGVIVRVGDWPRTDFATGASGEATFPSGEDGPPTTRLPGAKRTLELEGPVTVVTWADAVPIDASFVDQETFAPLAVRHGATDRVATSHCIGWVGPGGEPSVRIDVEPPTGWVWPQAYRNQELGVSPLSRRATAAHVTIPVPRELGLTVRVTSTVQSGPSHAIVSATIAHGAAGISSTVSAALAADRDVLGADVQVRGLPFYRGEPIVVRVEREAGDDPAAQSESAEVTLTTGTDSGDSLTAALELVTEPVADGFEGPAGNWAIGVGGGGSDEPSLGPAGEIRVRAVDRLASPMVGAHVVAIRTEDEQRFTETTDRFGQCRLAGVPPGDYVVWLHDVGGVLTRSDATVSADVTTRLTVYEGPPRDVVVRVVDGSGLGRARRAGLGDRHGPRRLVARADRERHSGTRDGDRRGRARATVGSPGGTSASRFTPCTDRARRSSRSPRPRAARFGRSW